MFAKHSKDIKITQKLFLEAAKDGNIAIIKKYRETHSIFALNVTDELGNTALHVAAQYNHLDVIKFLISNGANDEQTNNKGYTASYVASIYQNEEIDEYLNNCNDQAKQAGFEVTDDKVQESDASTKTFGRYLKRLSFSSSSNKVQAQSEKDLKNFERFKKIEGYQDSDKENNPGIGY